MHPFSLSSAATARVTARCGKAHPFDKIDPTRTALVVIDMQNGFMDAGVAHALCPMALQIVPAVNRLADALRNAGGGVFWVQNTHGPTTLRDWSAMYDALTPARRAARIAAMTPGNPGHEFWAGLNISPDDTIVPKYRYSAFIQGSSDLPEQLRTSGFDTVLICGTVTNTCCESSARDAAMLNFSTIMVSDGNAAQNDAEHAASLTAFYLIFGDVLTVDEVIGAFSADKGAGSL
jgi:ureidoacrylate peracid hydrolase